MNVKVKLFARFRDKVGTTVTEVDATTVGELLRKLIDSHEEMEGSLLAEEGSGRELKNGVTVMLNGRNINFLNGVDTELDEHDSLALFPPIGGG